MADFPKKTGAAQRIRQLEDRVTVLTNTLELLLEHVGGSPVLRRQRQALRHLQEHGELAARSAGTARVRALQPADDDGDSAFAAAEDIALVDEGGVASAVEMPGSPVTSVEATPLAGLAAARARGEAAKVRWVQTGEVVTAKALADAWGLTPQALGPAAKRGEVFSVQVKNQRYYPSEFLRLHRQDVATVCEQLEGMEPAEKLVFWKRRHGALGGRTLTECLEDQTGGSQLQRIVRLAQAATEQMRLDAAAAA